MRYLTSLFFTLLMLVAFPAKAGMGLTLVMVTPEQFSQAQRDEAFHSKMLFEPSPDVALEMDKAWHGIHYLLTGDPLSSRGVLGQVIFGGVEFGPDIGYGPARYINPRQVGEIAAALKNFPVDRFKDRYDPKAMTEAEIYPSNWDREGQEGLGWLVAGLAQLIEFYGRAAAQGKGVILAIL